MKMNRFVTLALAASAVFAASCKQEEPQPLVPDPESPLTGKHLIVKASAKSDDSRTSVYHDDDAGKYAFLWGAGDAIGLLEADPAASSNRVENYESSPLAESCEVGFFPFDLAPRAVGGELHYMAFYPVSALTAAGDGNWDASTSSFALGLTLPSLQHPTADSFDPAADLLVSREVVESARPESLELYFARIGTVVKLVVTGLDPGTKVHGGRFTLGYVCQGAVTFESSTGAVHYPSGADGIDFRYTETNAQTGALEGTPLVADENGKVTLWLRVKSGVSDQRITLTLDTESAEGEPLGHSREINLVNRNTSVTFKEGGVTTLSVSVAAEIPGDGVIPRDLRTIPALYIDTPDAQPIVSKTEWIEGTRIRIYGDDGQILLDDKKASIRGRGNTTWNHPKKPYYFKLNKKTNLLGTGKSKKYILLANWLDRTLLRNAVAFEAARRTSMAWTPADLFVEVYLNGEHKGNYLLCEKIEVEDARVQADYLFSMDLSNDEDISFYTTYGYRVNLGLTGLPVEVKHPDLDDYAEDPDGLAQVLSEGRTLLDQLGAAIVNKESESLADLDTFCDWYLLHELVGNPEPNHPKSCYITYYNGRFYAGPAWDFDWGTYRVDREGLLIPNSMFYRDLFKDPAFVTRLRERWKVLKPKFQTLGTFIDAKADWIRSSEAVNHQMWPITSNPNGDINLTFQQAVDRMKLSLDLRIAALDEALDTVIEGDVVTSGQDAEFYFFSPAL